MQSWRPPYAVIVELVDVHVLQGAPPCFKKGSLAKEMGGRKFLPLLPSQKRLLMLLGEWC